MLLLCSKHPVFPHSTYRKSQSPCSSSPTLGNLPASPCVPHPLTRCSFLHWASPQILVLPACSSPCIGGSLPSCLPKIVSGRYTSTTFSIPQTGPKLQSAPDPPFLHCSALSLSPGSHCILRSSRTKNCIAHQCFPNPRTVSTLRVPKSLWINKLVDNRSDYC